MKTNHIIIAAAAAMSMLAASNVATAGDVTYPAGAATPVSVAKAVKTNQAQAAYPNTITATKNDVTVPATPLLQAGDIITFTVAGAVFDRGNMTAVPVSLVAADGVVGTQVLDATNTILTATVATSGTTLAAAGTTAAVNLTPTFDLTASTANTNVTVTMTVSRTVLGAASIVHQHVATVNPTSYVSKVVKPSVYTIPAVTSTQDIATVASNFLRLDSASGNVDTTGKVLTVPAANIPVTASGDTATPSGTQLVTLAGLPIGTTSVTWAPTLLGVGGAITQATATGAAPAAATAGSTFWLDGAGNGYALINAVATAAGPIKAPAPVVITLNGTTQVVPTNVTVKIDYVAGAADPFVSHSILAPTTFESLVRNGSAFSVNASGPLNTIKITDMSGGLTATTGQISVTAFDALGAVAPGVAPVIPALVSNGTNTIAMSTLTTAYPTAIRFDFVVESTEILASNVKKTAAGTTVSNYRNSSASGTKPGNGAL